MSDLSDVNAALVTTIANIIYPQLKYDAPGETFDSAGNFDTPASTAPVAVTKWGDGSKWNSGRTWNAKKSPSITGTPFLIYPGWPSSSGLAADMALGKTHITVFPKAEERNTTRYGEVCEVITPPAPTLKLTISGPLVEISPKAFDAPNVSWDHGGNMDQAMDIPGLTFDSGGYYDHDSQLYLIVTVGGLPGSPQNVALRINGKFYVYSVQPNDTLATIAAGMAALVTGDVPGTYASGANIAIGPTGRIQAARVGGFGTVAREVRRQERVFKITIWTNAPALRDTVSSAVDAALAQMRFLQMPDGFSARLIYKNSMMIDAEQKAAIYRRDINYSVEYATTVSEQLAAVIAPSVNYQSFTVTA